MAFFKVYFPPGTITRQGESKRPLIQKQGVGAWIYSEKMNILDISKKYADYQVDKWIYSLVFGY